MSEIPLPFVIFPLFFFVAFVYSTVGHGGASGYLALFALFGIATPEIAPVALMLNIIVASMSWWRFAKNGYFSWRLLLPFVVTSIPAAFVGGLILISQTTFLLILGLALLWASARLAFAEEIKVDAVEMEKGKFGKLWFFGLPIGGGVGVVSGMVGVGGGIFLSPIILLKKWADAKRTAAVSSAFIVLNSLGGIAGNATRVSVDYASFVPFAVAVVLGGILGSYTGAVRVSARTLQVLLAVVLVIAGVKTLLKVY